MEERDPDCWVKLWRMDHAEEPESEADIALIRPRREHVSRFEKILVTPSYGIASIATRLLG